MRGIEAPLLSVKGWENAGADASAVKWPPPLDL